MINIEEVKKKILAFLNQKGPSLPVQIAREIKLEPMFASAILAELTNSKQVKLSNLKVGSSPLYFLSGQEEKLESFAEENLGGAEKEAFLKLKQSKVLKDESQSPVIRVALRSIRDFAFPFKHNNKIFWKYVFIPDEEIEKLLPKKKAAQFTGVQAKKGGADTFPPKQISPIFKKLKTRTPKQNFLEQIKNFLQKQNTQIISLEEVSQRKVIAKVRKDAQNFLLFAFNKKRLTNPDIIKAYRKAKEQNLPYYIIIKSEPTKKMQETLRAHKALRKIDKLEY